MTTIKQEKFPIFAQQMNTLQKNGTRYFSFYCYTGPGIHEDVGKVIQNGDGYDSIEELIASVPLTKFAYASLPRRIAIDFGLVYGVDYPELGIVAYTGAFETMRPIAAYVYNGSMKYIKHPQFDWMVQRYK